MTKSKPRKHVPRGPNKPKEISEVRQLVSRPEARAILGCPVDQLKKLEQCKLLTVIKLHPTARCVYYRLDEVNSIAGKPKTNSTGAETSASRQTG